MNLTHLIKIWLLMAIVAFSANGAVKANVASGPQNLGLEVHQEKSIAKPLMRQGKSQISTMAASDIFIEEDKETGLLYAKARYYDADTGKFLSEDAWEGDNMIAPSLHKYLYAYQNPTVWIDPTGNCPSGQIGYVGAVSAGCRGPRTWGERNPISASIVGPMSSVAFRRNGNLYDPINKQELTGKQAFDAKFNTLFTALPASKAKALSSAASRFAGAQATKIKDAATPFINKANEIAGPAIRATKDQVGKITKPIANAISNKLKPNSWNFNPSARFDEAVAEQARQRAKSNAGGANLVEESVSQPTPNSGTTAGAVDAEAGGFSQYDQFRKADGSWDWPENLGFQGAPNETVLPVGTRVDRYGNTKGSFLSPEGVPFEQRALAPGSRAEPYNVYEVKKELPVLEGEIAPAFGQPGGGTQILPNLPERTNVKQLLRKEYLEKVEK